MNREYKYTTGDDQQSLISERLKALEMQRRRYAMDLAAAEHILARADLNDQRRRGGEEAARQSAEAIAELDDQLTYWEFQLTELQSRKDAFNGDSLSARKPGGDTAPSATRVEATPSIRQGKRHPEKANGKRQEEVPA